MTNKWANSSLTQLLKKKKPKQFFKIEGFINIWEGSIPKSGMNISFGVCLFIYLNPPPPNPLPPKVIMDLDEILHDFICRKKFTLFIFLRDSSSVGINIDDFCEQIYIDSVISVVFKTSL